MAERKKKKRQRPALILGLAACVALLGYIFVLRFSGGEEEAPADEPQSPVIAETAADPTPEPKRFSPEELARWAEDAGALRLSELMVKNTATLMDEDGDFSDWLELENSSARAVDLNGWVLSDKESGGSGWQFPAVTLEAGERLLVFASGKDRSEGALHADFSLSADERLSLCAPDGTEAFSLRVPALDKDSSLIAAEGGDYTVCVWPTPGESNDAAGYEAWQESQTRTSPLLISEAMTSNVNGGGEVGAGLDWVELKNVSGESIELSQYYLSDDRNDYLRWQLPEKTLDPGKSFLVVCDTEGGTSLPCAPFSLDGERESLFLATQTQLCDYVSLHDIPYSGSCGRAEGENGFFYFTKPSPNAANGEGLRRISASPLASQGGGVFEDTDGLTVSLSAPGKIYYTLDGSYPGIDSQAYSEPIRIVGTTILRAVCLEEGALPSRVLTESYFLNEGHSLPVLSLVADEYSSFRYIYARKNKDLEIPGNLALYEEDGSFSIGCGIQMSGATSLDLPKKNVSVHFRGAYGASSLVYDVFDGGVDEFGSLTIRAGQDYYYSVIRNEVCQNLALQVSPDHLVSQRSKYCVLYVNGVYYGIYALKEKINREFYASWADVSKESVLVEEGPVPDWLPFGYEVYDYIMDHDMKNAEYYAHFCEIADVDSFVDWLVMEGYCANPDILLGNIRYAKSSEGDGKWHVVFYDLDNALRRRFNTFYNVIGTDDRVYIQQISRMLFRLLENDSFRARFLERFSAAIYGPLSDENVLAEIDRLYAQIESELPRDFRRWSRSRDSFDFEFNYFRNFIQDGYAQHAIDTVCELLNVTDSERAQYFPYPAS